MVQPALTPGTQGGKPCLLADLEKIGIQWTDRQQDWAVTYSITDDHGNIYSITEKYSAIENKITIHDVNELLRPYFDLSDHPGLTGFSSPGLKSLSDVRRVLFKIVIYCSIKQECGTFRLAYSNASSGFLHTGTGDKGIGSRFLSRCDLQTVTAIQPCAVSWFGHGETLKVKLLHYVDGTYILTEVIDITSEDSNNMQTYNFTLQDLAKMKGLDVKDIIYADVQLFLNSAPQDSIRFMHEPYHRAQERTFAFIGVMGEPEFVVLTGNEQREAEYEGMFLMEHNDYRKADTKLRQIHNSYTGALSEGERLLIWDMAASPWVYVIEDGQLREVTITEVELTDSLPHMEPVGYRVKWRYTDERKQRTFSRKITTQHVGIFDKTFDETFE